MAKNKTIKFTLFFLFVFLLSSCLIRKKEIKTENNFNCNCSDYELYIGYTTPLDYVHFLDNYISFVDTTKQDYVILYFPEQIRDTVEIFFNGTKLIEFDFSKIQYPNKIIRYNYSKEKHNPILTIKTKGDNPSCMQLTVDRRFRIMRIQKDYIMWYVNYQNFFVESY